jgi:anthranilate phosphoribosyltransferase
MAKRGIKPTVSAAVRCAIVRWASMGSTLGKRGSASRRSEVQAARTLHFRSGARRAKLGRVLKQLTHQLLGAEPLTAEQVGFAVEQLVAEVVEAELKAGFLVALAQKGETVEEITCFARELRARSVQPMLDTETRALEILDVCGTGGDRLNTFNISTTVALIAAAAGVPVAKHGNRAITSQSGSADVLEALGIRIDLTPEEAAISLREHRFAFFFAPNYHPAFKHIAPARRLCAARGQRTIFNFLGPLLNPVRPSAQLVGVPHPELCAPMAQVLQSLGARRAMVVCGRVEPAPDSAGPAYLDELSTLGESAVAEFYQDKGFALSMLKPEFLLQPATLADLRGGDSATNAQIVRRILNGEEKGPRLEAVLLNASAALFVAGKVRTMADGWELGGEIIRSGKARRKLDELTKAFPR